MLIGTLLVLALNSASPNAGLPAVADALVAGKPAPAMSTDAVIKGKDVKTLEKGKVYVVEFWATWCGPCIQSIPHLTELQKKHPDITIIGVAGFERDPKDGDAAAKSAAKIKKVTDMVERQGSKMDYTVLYDGDGTMGKTWLEAARQQGIPCAFVVDTTGTVTYIGGPNDLGGAIDRAKASKSSSDSKASKDSKSSTDSKSSKDSKTSKDSQTSSDFDSDSDSASDSDSSSSSDSKSDSQKSSSQDSSSDKKSSSNKSSDKKSNSSKSSGSKSSGGKSSGSKNGSGSNSGSTSGGGSSGR